LVPSTASTPTSTIPAFAQDPAEQIRERGLVANAKARDGGMVGDLVGADHPEGDVLSAAALDLPR
jgi:hypothetical protein